jgi:hypothetical protein
LVFLSTVALRADEQVTPTSFPQSKANGSVSRSKKHPRLGPIPIKTQTYREEKMELCGKLLEKWMDQQNEKVPTEIRTYCKQYAELMKKDGTKTSATPFSTPSFDPYPDSLLKSLDLSAAIQLGIPAETKIDPRFQKKNRLSNSEMNMKNQKEKLVLLRKLEIQGQTLIIADYSKNPQPATNENSYSDMINVYLKKKSGLKLILQKAEMWHKLGLLRVDERSPVFLNIRNSGGGSGENGTIYQLMDNGTLEKKLTCGGWHSIGELNVNNFGSAGMVAIDSYQSEGGDFDKRDCENYTRFLYWEMIPYKWDGKQFEKLCKYYFFYFY